MSAEYVYIVALLAILGVVTVVGVIDYGLHRKHKPTISRWLHWHPMWFLCPAVVILVGLAAFALHLWLFRP